MNDTRLNQASAALDEARVVIAALEDELPTESADAAHLGFVRAYINGAITRLNVVMEVPSVPNV